jgi:hypothetical protein
MTCKTDPKPLTPAMDRPLEGAGKPGLFYLLILLSSDRWATI